MDDGILAHGTLNTRIQNVSAANKREGIYVSGGLDVQLLDNDVSGSSLRSIRLFRI